MTMTDWTRIAKLAGMLGSAHDGEILAAVVHIHRELTAQGLTWGDLTNRLSGGGPPGLRTFRDPRDVMDDIIRTARNYRDQEERARQQAARQRGEW
jgi:hypothetical protein